MSFLKNLDLYTVLIVLCVLLLPVCAWWCYNTNEEIKLCQSAVREASRPGGLLEQIGALQKKVEIVNQNRGGSRLNPVGFIEGQIIAAASNGGLGSSDFGLNSPKEEPATIPGSKQKVSDYVVTVDWRRKDLEVKLDFIEAVLWNCESGAGVSGATGAPSIWRLRALEIVNMTDDKKTARFDTPPPELEDRWAIKKMQFARREPRKN